jgi:hypothetical protein
MTTDAGRNDSASIRHGQMISKMASEENPYIEFRAVSRHDSPTVARKLTGA